VGWPRRLRGRLQGHQGPPGPLVRPTLAPTRLVGCGGGVGVVVGGCLGAVRRDRDLLGCSHNLREMTSVGSAVHQRNPGL
jgi:hypothetical protein